MFGKLFVVLAVMGSPVLASDNVPASPAPGKPAEQEYTIKKICHTVEVAGSFIPRRSCVNKRVPVKKPDTETDEAASTNGAADAGASKKQ